MKVQMIWHCGLMGTDVCRYCSNDCSSDIGYINFFNYGVKKDYNGEVTNGGSINLKEKE